MNPLLNKLSIGSWITFAHPAIAEIMASAGFDWLAIDLEHSVITIREAEELIRVIDLKGVVPLVRLSSNNKEQIKRLMDAGAHGVIVPMINSPEEAESAVAAVKYPPRGERSFGLARAQGYGTTFQKYVDWAEMNTIVVVQIEHVDAVNNIDEIFSVPGVDAYFVGPYDLSGSLGIPGQFKHPKFLEVMDQIKKASSRFTKPGGKHIVEPNKIELKQCIEDGYEFIAYSLDCRMLETMCRDVMDTIAELRS